jgi:hypothetical protein
MGAVWKPVFIGWFIGGFEKVLAVLVNIEPEAGLTGVVLKLGNIFNIEL